jgi:hypothetical protein
MIIDLGLRDVNYYGELYIAERISSYDDKDIEHLKGILGDIGFKNIVVEFRRKFFYLNGFKK